MKREGTGEEYEECEGIIWAEVKAEILAGGTKFGSLERLDRSRQAGCIENESIGRQIS